MTKIFLEQKAKEAELQRRQIARQAREKHRRSLLSTDKPFKLVPHLQYLRENNLT